MQGLNYFAANGTEAFDQLVSIIDTLHFDTSERRRLVDNLKRGKQYLKSDFKVHVSCSSHVADHCISFSLSDPTSSYYSQTCDDHGHDELCLECSNLTQSLPQLGEAIDENVVDQEETKRIKHRYNLAYSSIQAWKCHLLRSINQDLSRDKVLEILPDDAVFLNLDFAMK